MFTLNNITKNEELKPSPWAFNYLSLILIIVGVVITLIIVMVKSSRLEEKLEALLHEFSCPKLAELIS